MPADVTAQWVVRLPDRIVQLQRPLRAIRVFSTAEVLQFKTYYGTDESKSRIERQRDTNARHEDVTFAYWVLLFPADDALPLDVLCCTVQRETTDHILDSLWAAMFTNCGDNTYVDLRELLAADLVTPDQVAATPAVGRFVDLGDGATRRPRPATGSVGTVTIPVQSVAASGRTTESPIRNWVRSVRSPDMGSSAGRSIGQVRHSGFSVTDSQGIELRAPPEPMYMLDDDTRVDTAALITAAVRQGATSVEFTPQNLAELEAVIRQTTDPNIERAETQATNSELQLRGAALRQRVENRNTQVVALPGGLAGLVNASLLVPPRDSEADREARQRANPMFGVD